MNEFFWTSGHLGWGIFALAMFTGLWALLADLIWRLRNMRIGRLAAAMSVGWVIGSALILLCFQFGSR